MHVFVELPAMATLTLDRITGRHNDSVRICLEGRFVSSSHPIPLLVFRCLTGVIPGYPQCVHRHLDGS